MRNERQSKQLTQTIYRWISLNKPDTIRRPFLGSISNVYLANNNHYACISISDEPSHGKLWVEYFNSQKSKIKHFIAKELNWRKTPLIEFKLDNDHHNHQVLKDVLFDNPEE
ncbi:MAG: ribosome-binding factor A [Candidatus Comchoanobacterales bacterium]